MKRQYWTWLMIGVAALGSSVWAQDDSIPALPSGLRVRAENQYFDVFPRIVPANQESTIQVIPKFDHVRPAADCTYLLTYAPMDQVGTAVKDEALVPENGHFLIKRRFEGEQQHTLQIIRVNEKKERKTLCTLRIYSLEPDLFALRPFKGDFHMHSNFSDGIESPAYVGGIGRRVGLDYLALTDHKFYPSSQDLVNIYAKLPVDIRLFPGEENHPPGNPVHIVSLGANAAVAPLYGGGGKTPDAAKEQEYRAEVAKIQETLKDIPAGVDPFQYASCLWAAEKIRERGGLSMFAHSAWYNDLRFGVAAPLTDLLLEKRVFNIMELISGMDSSELREVDTNQLQVSKYYEQAAKGNLLPVAGISDAHGEERSGTFGRNYTLTLALSPDFKDVAASLSECRTVAVETPSAGLARPYGPPRIVKYAHFLLREILPQHDQLCFEEGRLMLEYTGGDESVLERLRAMQGQTARLYTHYWGQ